MSKSTDLPRKKLQGFGAAPDVRYCASFQSTKIAESFGFLLRRTRRFQAFLGLGVSTTSMPSARCGLDVNMALFQPFCRPGASVTVLAAPDAGTYRTNPSLVKTPE